MSTIAQYNPGVAELGRKNQPNGYVGIDGDGDIVGTFAQRKGTAAEIAAITLADGELAFTTDTKELRLGDGATLGGNWFYSQAQFASQGADTGSSTLLSLGADSPDALVLPVTAGLYSIDAFGYGEATGGVLPEAYLSGPIEEAWSGTVLGSVNVTWNGSNALPGEVYNHLGSGSPPWPAPYRYRPSATIDESAYILMRLNGLLRFTAGQFKFSWVPRSAMAGMTRIYWAKIQKVAE